MVIRSHWVALGYVLALLLGILVVGVCLELSLLALMLIGGLSLVLGIAPVSVALIRLHRRALESNEFRILFDNTSVAFAYLDAELRFIRVNPAFAKAAALPVNAFQGRTLEALGFPASLMEECRQVVAKGVPVSGSGENGIFPAATTRFWKWRIEPVVSDAAQVSRMIVSVSEATEQQRAKEAAQRLEDGYRAVQEHVSEGLLICDNEGCIHEANAMAEHITGYSREQLRTMALFDLITPEEHERFLENNRPLEHSLNLRFETELTHARGERRVAEVVTTSFPYGEGRMNLASLRDVTERKMMEEMLRKREMRSRAIFQHGGMGVAVVMPSGYMGEYNSAMLAISGYTPQAFAAIQWCDLVPEAPCMDRIGTGDVTYTGRHLLQGGDGEERWVDLALTPVNAESGELEFAVAMLMDVTLAHEAEVAASQHERELEQANAWKSRFIATASHDIRQPLQAVTLLLHLLDTHPLDSSARGIVDRIAIAMRNLSDMVNSILDLSKFEAGLVLPEIAPVPLDEVLQVIDEEYRAIAESKGLSFHLQACGDVWVQTDRRLLARVLGNLVSNAVRYTDQGKVQVTFTARENEVEIEISDTGIGIPEEECQRVFEPYQQGNNSGSHRQEGMGLGLTIVEQLARLLGLKVDVNSHVGIGTLFTVSVPLARDHTGELPTERPIPPLQRAKVQILVIDDEPDIREGLRAMLSKEGYVVATASSGEQALEVLRARLLLPNIILADYRLQQGTGLDAIRRLRDFLGKPIPAILLTGDTYSSIRSEAVAQQCEMIVKPATAQRLRLAIASALDRRPVQRGKRVVGDSPAS